MSTPLKPDDAEKFLNAKIGGEVILEGAGSREFFQSASLSFGASFKLTELARKVTGREDRFYFLFMNSASFNKSVIPKVRWPCGQRNSKLEDIKLEQRGFQSSVVLRPVKL